MRSLRISAEAPPEKDGLHRSKALNRWPWDPLQDARGPHSLSIRSICIELVEPRLIAGFYSVIANT
jgi:hypothetical protein